MPHGDDDTWVQTFSSKRFYPLDPREEDVDIIDIAHALAMKCRYTGHCKSFFSVAQHSADNIMLATERRDLMPNPPRPWKTYGVQPLDRTIVPWTWQRAKIQFVWTYSQLSGHAVILK